MEDFHAAGGMGALLRELRPLLHLDTIDIEGRTLAERLDEPVGWIDRKVIRAFDDPVSPLGGLVTLTGSLAPDGAIFKRAAATPSLFESEGRAVVFTGLEDLSRRIDDPDLGKRRSRPIRKGLAWGLQSVDQRVCKSLAGGMEAATTENYEVRPNDQGRSSSIRDCG
jgi:dihydroxy-acid dehydratase